MRRTELAVLIVLLLMPRAVAAQGDPLGPEFRVNTYTTSYQFGRSVASLSLGDFVVVWGSYTQDGSSWGVFGQRYASSGTPLGPEFRINTYTPFSQFGASVATDPAGNFVVVWQSGGQYPFDSDVFGQRYASSGTPLGPEFRVNTYVPSTQYYPSVAASAAGNFVVVWNSLGQDGSGLGVFGQRYAAVGSPLGPEFRVNTFTTGHQGNAAVACDTAGNFVVTWPSYLQDGSLWGVFGQRYASSGTPLGPEFRVNAYTTGTQHFPAVALDSSGNFVVVWQWDAQDGSARGIFGQRFTSTGTPLGEFRVNTYTTSEQSSPRVAADAAGAFVVVWASDDQKGSTYGIFGQRYDPVGTPLGPEFRVNTYTSFHQGFPAVSADSSGHFVVVWTSDVQDGSYTGVYGQRFSQIVPVELMQFGIE